MREDPTVGHSTDHPVPHLVVHEQYVTSLSTFRSVGLVKRSAYCFDIRMKHSISKIPQFLIADTVNVEAIHFKRSISRLLKTAPDNRYSETDLERRKYKTRHSTGFEFMLAFCAYRSEERMFKLKIDCLFLLACSECLA